MFKFGLFVLVMSTSMGHAGPRMEPACPNMEAAIAVAEGLLASDASGKDLMQLNGCNTSVELQKISTRDSVSYVLPGEMTILILAKTPGEHIAMVASPDVGLE